MVAMEKMDVWWIGQVVFCESGARTLEVNSLFPSADVNNGSIRWVCADGVTQIVNALIGINL